MHLLQTAKEQGARVVRDVYEESDENGTVRLATVQTVSSNCFKKKTWGKGGGESNKTDSAEVTRTIIFTVR